MKQLLLLLILIASLTTFTSWATAQNIAERDEEICRSLEDAQAQTQRLKECDLDRRELELLKQQLQNMQEKVANLQEKLKLKEEEVYLKDQMIVVKDQMIANQQANFDQMKDVADRAIKLAETKKPNVWQTWGPLGIIAIAVVAMASVL